MHGKKTGMGGWFGGVAILMILLLGLVPAASAIESATPADRDSGWRRLGRAERRQPRGLFAAVDAACARVPHQGGRRMVFMC